MSRTLVMKFGGTSVGGAAAIRQAAEIVRAARVDWDCMVVVVSAMSGVTDALLQGANAAARGDDAQPRRIALALRDRHTAVIDELLPAALRPAIAAAATAGIDEFETMCAAVRVLGEATPRALDAIAALGERLNTPIVTAVLQAAGTPAQAVDSVQVVITDNAHQAASPDYQATRQRVDALLRPLFETGRVAVLAGFIGGTPAGVVTTLGRGGSDFSAAIFAVALGAEEVWIFTDVDGVMTADPRVTADARTLSELTFREVSELAFYGAKVLHPKTIRPVVERNIALRIKNTFNPAEPGTRVVPDNGAAAGSIKAVTAFKGQCIINLEGRGMLGIPGIAARTFAAVARTGTSVAMISQASSEQSICFVVPCAAGISVVAALQREFQLELARRDIDSINCSDESAVVTVVGAGMRYTPGIAGRIFGALGAGRVNVIAIAQGSSECSISLVVAAAQADDAVRAIHGLIVGE